MVRFKMRYALMMLLFLGIVFAGCGVKKNPDSYYTHPLDFDGAPAPSPSATPGLAP